MIENGCDDIFTSTRSNEPLSGGDGLLTDTRQNYQRLPIKSVNVGIFNVSMVVERALWPVPIYVAELDTYKWFEWKYQQQLKKELNKSILWRKQDSDFIFLNILRHQYGRQILISSLVIWWHRKINLRRKKKRHNFFTNISFIGSEWVACSLERHSFGWRRLTKAFKYTK